MGKKRNNALRSHKPASVLAWLAVSAGMLAVAGCTNIDCPLNSVVSLNCGLYAAESLSPAKYTDTLSVTGRGGVSLLNRAVDISSFSVSLGHTVETDTLVVHFGSPEGQNARDTLFVDHTNEPHFESIDCPPSMFHTIRSVRWTSHSLQQFPLTIDSVAISSPIVNYDEKENFKIYLRSTSSLPSAAGHEPGK